MPNPLGDKKGCNVGFFFFFFSCLFCLPGYLLPSYYTWLLFHQGTVLGHRMMGMVFIWHGGEREVRAMETKMRNRRCCERWKSMRKS